MSKKEEKKENYADIQISKVTLTNGGLKGCKVEYKKTEKVGDHEFANDFKPSMKYPVHEVLLKNFGWLKRHLLLICGYELDDKTNLEMITEVTGVRVASGGFIITGQVDVFGSGKCVVLNTPLVTDEEEYVKFLDVIKIIEAIFEETKVYLSKAVTMEAVEYVVRENKHNPEFNEESFRALPEETQKKFMTKYLAKNKQIAISEEELLDMKNMDDLVFLKHEDDQEEEPVVDEEPEITAGGEPNIEKPVLKESPVVEELVMELTPNNFVIEQTETGTVLSIASNNDDEIDLSEIVKKQEAAKVSTAQRIKPVVASVGIDTPFEDIE